MKMVVGIDYTQDGSRTISALKLASSRIDSTLMLYKAAHDEVYITEFDQNNQGFIQAVIDNGKRFS